VAAISLMMPLGTKAPDFSLTDVVTGDTVSRDDFGDASALLVMFICNHCPYVKHVAAGLAALGEDYADADDVAIVAISSNDATDYPEDGPEAMAAEVSTRGYRFPYLYDESQDVARAYSAACTPDFFLFGPDRELVYRGRMDESRPNSLLPVTGAELRAAIEAVRRGEPVATEQFPSMGCSIKWRDV
jgi:peroxiredoxin